MGLPFINADRRQWRNQRTTYAMHNDIEMSRFGSLSNGFGNLIWIGYIAWNHYTIGASSNCLIGDRFEGRPIAGSQGQSGTRSGQS
jgi:hypothetical protein